MTAESYIDHCVASVRSIDPDLLGTYELGGEVGIQGAEYRMRALGKIGVLGSETYCGLKIPVQQADVELRTQGELQAIELLLSRMPELTPQVPRFMALLTIDGSEPIAQLTEDASRGGQLEIRPNEFNSGLAGSILEAFSNIDDMDIDDIEDVAEKLLSFVVGGEQRLLDFTPPPVTDHEAEAMHNRLYELMYEQRALRIDVNSQSRFAQSLAYLRTA